MKVLILLRIVYKRDRYSQDKSLNMRQRFEQQISLGSELISDVKFPLRSRDELPPVLKALQYIYVTPELNERVFSLLEAKVCNGKKKTGRPGMDLWHILVLAVVRHTLDTNWDRLEHVANYDLLTREILGIHINLWGAQKKEFSYQTIIDNVSLIDEELLHQMNQIVVEHGQDLLKKKGEENVLKLKTDSYALETDVHFPTDLNLLWDSIRKVLDTVEKLTSSNGWRKIKCIRSNVKSVFRATSKQVFSGGPKDSKKTEQVVKAYLKHAKQIYQRTEVVIPTKGSPMTGLVLLEELKHYRNYLQLFVDQVDRRLIKGEEIAASEKIFSIFEPHTEWIKKGKLYPNVELGKLLLITTDQFQFIVDYKVMEHEKDAAQVPSLYERIKTNLKKNKIVSHSFDKGFYSKDNFNIVSESGTEQVIMPKKGKKNKQEQERESHPQFKKLRNKHSAVESNINMLEHHGLNRCPDKGLRGLKEYVGLSVLAYNLHILGNHLIAVERKKEERLGKQRERYRQVA